PHSELTSDESCRIALSWVQRSKGGRKRWRQARPKRRCSDSCRTQPFPHYHVIVPHAAASATPNRDFMNAPQRLHAVPAIFEQTNNTLAICVLSQSSRYD